VCRDRLGIVPSLVIVAARHAVTAALSLAKFRVTPRDAASIITPNE